jgi:N-acetyl-gamma-glutamyl-phosphate reductase
LKEKLIKSAGIIINTASGVSGAGRRAEYDFGYCEVTENYKAYAVTTHRHMSEIEAILTEKTGKDVTVNFTPHLLPVKRGILATIYAPVTAKFTDEKAAEAAFLKYYAGEKFITYTGPALPELKHITDTNNFKVGCKFDKKNNLLVIIATLDNLAKGASGQAVQNMNIMFGVNESEGLI